MGAASVPMVLVVLLAALIAQQHGLILRSHASVPAPYLADPTHAERIALGVTTLALARDSWRRWSLGDLGSVNVFEHAARAHARVIMWYADWMVPFSASQLRDVARRNSIPEITWEPWNADDRNGAHQPQYALKRIIAGHYDAHIRSWARGFAAYGKPVRLRFAQEMNGNWYPWDERANGNHSGEFVAMWRHVHHLFTLAGARNVTWVWAPVNGNAAAHYYPGRRWVNALGLTCLNGGTTALAKRWRTFASICAKPLMQLGHLAPRMPIEISETGSSTAGGNKAVWIVGLFAYLRQHPEVQTMIWFNLRKGPDWRIQSSSASAAAFAKGLRAS